MKLTRMRLSTPLSKKLLPHRTRQRSSLLNHFLEASQHLPATVYEEWMVQIEDFIQLAVEDRIGRGNGAVRLKMNECLYVMGQVGWVAREVLLGLVGIAMLIDPSLALSAHTRTQQVAVNQPQFRMMAV